MPNNRRSFLTRSLAGAAAFSFGGLRATKPADDAWLAAIAPRKHKAFLDIRSFATDGGPFRRATNLFTALQDSYAAAPADIGVAFGAHGTALGYLMNQAIWSEFNLVEKIAPALRMSEAAALREPNHDWARLGADGVRDLRARGVRVLACRTTIGRWARDFAATNGQTAEQVTARLIAGLHEGVEPVPAMIAAAVLAQERGLGYVAIE